jgi:hypothetical protein
VSQRTDSSNQHATLYVDASTSKMKAGGALYDGESLVECTDLRRGDGTKCILGKS